jgi:hypothetical protein
MFRFAVLPVVAVALAGTASATTIVINPNRVAGIAPSQPPLVEPIRISLGINTFVPSPAGADPEQILKAQEGGRRMVYESAAHECDVLRTTIAKDCAIESININVQHVPAAQNYAQGRVEGYNINGNVNFRITAKPPAAATPPGAKPPVTNP